MEFVRNNIRYRSAASKALEGYYNAKAFILNELISPKNDFGETPKELMLLLFNSHADWLHFAEHQLLDKDTLTQDDVRVLCDEHGRLMAAIWTIIDDRPEVFDRRFIQHWRTIHAPALAMFYTELESIIGITQIIAFPLLTSCLEEHLNATLFELYELDTLLGSDITRERLSTNQSCRDRLILFIDDTRLRYREHTNTSPEMDRFLYYADNIINTVLQFRVEVRNYSSRAKHEGLFNLAFEELRKALEGMPCIEGVEMVHRT